MVDVVNRTTKEHRRSVNDPDYPTASWIHAPDLSAVAGFEPKYWNISGDVVSLMSPAERAAVDAAELAAARDGIAGNIEAVQSYERAFAEVLLDEMNLHASRVTAILNAIDNNTTLANIRTAVAAIQDVPQRTLAQLRSALRAKLDG